MNPNKALWEKGDFTRITPPGRACRLDDDPCDIPERDGEAMRSQ
jgi:hypothetical protein